MHCYNPVVGASYLSFPDMISQWLSYTVTLYAQQLSLFLLSLSQFLTFRYVPTERRVVVRVIRPQRKIYSISKWFRWKWQSDWFLPEPGHPNWVSIFYLHRYVTCVDYHRIRVVTSLSFFSNLQGRTTRMYVRIAIKVRIVMSVVACCYTYFLV